MPKLTNSVPKYRHHKRSGQAVVTLHGRDVYLGPYNSKGSKLEYDRVIAEWLNAQLRRGCCFVLVVSFPGNSMARSVLIQSSPGSLEIGSLEQDVPAHLLSSPDILDALFLHASRRREYDRAELYARKLLGIDQKTKHAQMRLGSILASKSIDGKLCRTECNLQELQSKATEAIRLLSEFISGDSPSRFTKAYARYHRGLALEALDRNDEAEADPPMRSFQAAEQLRMPRK